MLKWLPGRIKIREVSASTESSLNSKFIRIVGFLYFLQFGHFAGKHLLEQKQVACHGSFCTHLDNFRIVGDLIYRSTFW